MGRKGSRNRQRERHLPALSGTDPTPQHARHGPKSPPPSNPPVNPPDDSPPEVDWLAESKCAHCYRKASKKTLIKNTTREGKSFCHKCWDKLPAHARRAPVKTKTPRKNNTKWQDPRALKRENKSILKELPGDTIDQKIQSGQILRRVDEEADQRRLVREARRERERRELNERDPLMRCECGEVMRREKLIRHQQFTGHLFRSRVEVD